MNSAPEKDIALDDLSKEFIGENSSYYQNAFSKIQQSEGFVFSWNVMAAIFGPLWGALRGIWGFFWIFIVLELFALVQIGRGLWGELGGDKLARYDRLINNIAKREEQAKALQAAGDSDAAATKLEIAENLRTAAADALAAAICHALVISR